MTPRVRRQRRLRSARSCRGCRSARTPLTSLARHSLPGRYSRTGVRARRRRRPVLQRQRRQRRLHQRAPDARRVRPALNLVPDADELRDVDHRRVAVRVADPHRGGQLRRSRRRTTSWCCPAACRSCRRPGTERCASDLRGRALGQHALQASTTAVEGDAGVEHLHARVLVRVQPRAVGAVDVVDVVGVVVQALVGDRLHSRRHVDRAHRVGARWRTRRRAATGARSVWPVEQVRRVRHAIRRVDDPVQADDLRQAGERAVDRRPRLLPAAVTTPRPVASLMRNGLLRIVGVGKAARRGSVDQVVRLRRRPASAAARMKILMLEPVWRGTSAMLISSTRG